MSGLSAVYNEKAEGVTDLPEGKKRETENPRIQGEYESLVSGDSFVYQSERVKRISLRPPSKVPVQVS